MCTKAETRHHHPTAGPCVRPPSVANFSASSSSSVHNPHWTSLSLLAREASDRATPRQTTHLRSNNSDREPPSGLSHLGSQPLTSQRHSTQLSTIAYLRALRDQGVEEAYIRILMKLYDKQRATTHTDVAWRLSRCVAGTRLRFCVSCSGSLRSGCRDSAGARVTF